jgi:hypothetical protein
MYLDVKLRLSNKFWARHLGYRRNVVEVQQHTTFPGDCLNAKSSEERVVYKRLNSTER